MMKLLKYLAIILTFGIISLLLLFTKFDIPADELKLIYAPPPSQFVTMEGMNVHYRADGNESDSIPMVLLHGTGASLHTFDVWVNDMSSHKKVFRMDMPGFGLTGPFPHQNYMIGQYVEFLNEFMKKMNIKSCILAGNSLGGQIAWNYALSYPNKVHKLILIDAAGLLYAETKPPLAFKIARIPIVNQLLTIITPKSVARKSIEDVYSDQSLVTDALVDRYYDLTLRSGNRQAMIDRLTTPGNYDNVPQLKNLNCPTLILWGRDDMLIPLSSAYEFSKLIANDTIVILDKCGHVPMEECPEQSIKAVLDFIR